MRRVPVKPTLSSPPSSPSATLVRVALECSLSPAQVLQVLAAARAAPVRAVRKVGPPTPPTPRQARTAAPSSAPTRCASPPTPRTRSRCSTRSRPSTAQRPAPTERSAGAGSGGWATGWRRASSASRSTPTARSRSRTSTSPTTTTSCARPRTGSGTSRRWSPRLAATRSSAASANSLTELRRPAPAPPQPDVSPLHLSADDAAHHIDAVAQCRRRIAAGEIFQANLCLRLHGETDARATDLFAAALEHLDPPYGATFATPRGGIASLSPELFLRRRGRQIVTGPIKGTIARDPDPLRGRRRA